MLADTMTSSQIVGCVLILLLRSAPVTRAQGTENCINTAQQNCATQYTDATGQKATNLNSAAGGRTQVNTAPKTNELNTTAAQWCQAVIDTYNCMRSTVQQRCAGNEPALKTYLQQNILVLFADPRTYMTGLHTNCENMITLMYTSVTSLSTTTGQNGAAGYVKIWPLITAAMAASMRLLRL